MTIQNPVKFVEGLWDWEILDGCFGKTKIKCSDLDGCVERRGKVLVIETKSPGAKLDENDGQYIMFKNMVKHNHITVFVVWGNNGKPERIQEFHRGGNILPIQDIDLDGLKNRVEKWFEWADGKNQPSNN